MHRFTGHFPLDQRTPLSSYFRATGRRWRRVWKAHELTFPAEEPMGHADYISGSAGWLLRLEVLDGQVSG